ncbi:hypothetical protein HN51_036106 [Arachis hypogaea]|uniref:Uncharacterized protein n=1 Tax=Arachis hypogaea TaxID=3818 RepID=A0A445A1K4_ARAHY|nr:uncharacterized protein LOC107633108 [Arachis ipaensis]XP_025641130.1 uncharacterized protein LOC112735914 [Arachis hypogaea]QHO01395.1 uncharacterized protein DS421_13g414660 [Arachis hypogaea]RYR20301.1 hypothetical protein Ahy_B03g065414 [Arachis hypogaea]
MMNNGFSWMLHLPSSVIEFSQEEFLLFHRTDRELYTVLVFTLSRHPIQSLRVLAFWIWLERVGYPRTIQKILRLVLREINEVADEAVTCLLCISKQAFFPFNDIPVMKRLMDTEISLEILHTKRISVLQGVDETEHDVCLRAVGDLMNEALFRLQRYNAMMLRPRAYRRR